MEPAELAENSTIDVVGKNMQNAYFDEIIGHIEDIIMSDEFVELHNAFLNKHCHMFEDTEDNRLEYMDIFLEYISIFENFMEQKLQQNMRHFNMQRFAEDLSKDNHFENGHNFDEIFELLQSFNNFQVFKELILDYRRSHERKLNNLEIESILITQPIQIIEEQK